MSKQYLDDLLKNYWQKNKIYAFLQNEGRGGNFSIDTPPPTVSGKLHIGHIFSYSHIDFIARFQRMYGKNVFFPIGFDDNGLPTERLVEKIKKIKARNISREEFIKSCQEVVEIEEQKFEDLFKEMGYSFDWSLKYQTINRQTCKISQSSFIDMVNKNEVYRSNQPMMWDPVDQTALAQAEVEEKEKDSLMNYIKFKVSDNQEIIIATTRPELLPACQAIFVHPEDERYSQLIDKAATTPLFHKKVKILADDAVIIEKGTGAVMCCTFGDVTDIMWWQKHKLNTQIIIDKNGYIKDLSFTNTNCSNHEAANVNYQHIKGLKVSAAREKVIQMLIDENIMVKQEKITHAVKCAERSGAPLEILTTPQWFIKSLPHKEDLLSLADKIKWIPEKSMKNRLRAWVSSLAWDWCISRQRFFGIPFPVWYSKREGEIGKPIFADVKQLPVDPFNDLPNGYTKEEVEPDMDVMDTWATSSLTPQINTGFVYGLDTSNQGTNKQKLDVHKTLFPFDLRPQAHEIIRTWAFGTLLKSYIHESSVPWHNIMISGWCLAEDKTKMSKSKGNIIDPVDLLKKHCADSIRYWASTARHGVDTVFSEDVVLNGKRLINKLKNAAKFCNMHFKNFFNQEHNQKPDIKHDAKYITHSSDLWIGTRLNNVINASTNHFKNYDFSLVREEIEKFFWNDFCDIYLELVKSRVYNDDNNDPKGQISAVYSLYFCLKNIIKLFAPFLPYTTEKIYLEIFLGLENIQNIKGIEEIPFSSSIHEKGCWPEAIKYITQIDEVYHHVICDVIYDVLEVVRKTKTSNQLSIKAPIKLIEIAHSQIPEDLLNDLLNITNAEEIKLVSNLSESNLENFFEGANKIKVKIIL